MKKSYFLFFIFIISSSCFSQYLTYSELVGLLNIANDDVKVDEYLVKRGFEYAYGENNGGIKNYGYHKLKGKDYFTVGVYYNGKLNSTTYRNTLVNEFSGNVARWNYYKQIVDSYGYKQSNSQTKENGELWIDYINREFKITMVRAQSDHGNVYQIMISRL